MKRPKFLVEMKHGLGDCVCMLPAVDALRIRYPDAYIAMIVNGNSNVEIFDRSAAKIDRFYFFISGVLFCGTVYFISAGFIAPVPL